MRKSLIGQKFGRLLVLELSHVDKNRKSYWKCACECNNTNIIIVLGSKLLSGHTKSCGCLRIEKTVARSTSHGMAHTSEYKIWCRMIQRCTNPNNPSFADYGGRGILVCREWLNFESFFSDMGTRPSNRHSIERIDNSKGYCLENCKWALPQEQARNKRNNNFIEFMGLSLVAEDWSRLTGIKAWTIISRIKKLGWTAEKALTTKVRSSFLS